MHHLFGSDSWLYIIIVGFVVGLLARLVTPNNARIGCLFTILLGIAGALLAGWFGQRMGWYAPGQPAGFIGALIGAVVIFGLGTLFTRSKR